MEKPCRKCALKDNSRPFFNVGKLPKITITCTEFFYKWYILKGDYRIYFKNLTLFFLCRSHVFVYYSHVTRLYCCVILMSLVCTGMSSVCHSYVLVFCEIYKSKFFYRTAPAAASESALIFMLFFPFLA